MPALLKVLSIFLASEGKGILMEGFLKKPLAAEARSTVLLVPTCRA